MARFVAAIVGNMPAVELGPIDGVAILGAGTAFPERVLSNEEVLRLLAPKLWAARGRAPADDELQFLARSLEQTMGVRKRAWAHLVGTPLDHAREQSTLDLAVSAARAAMADAGIAAGDLSLVLC